MPHISGKNQGAVSPGGSSRKGVRAPIGVPGKRVRGGVQEGGGCWFPVKNKGQREGGGEGAVGWGQAKEPAIECARVCQNYPLENYPLDSPPTYPAADSKHYIQKILGNQF